MFVYSSRNLSEHNVSFIGNLTFDNLQLPVVGLGFPRRINKITNVLILEFLFKMSAVNAIFFRLGFLWWVLAEGLGQLTLFLSKWRSSVEAPEFRFGLLYAFETQVQSNTGSATGSKVFRFSLVKAQRWNFIRGF